MLKFSRYAFDAERIDFSGDKLTMIKHGVLTHGESKSCPWSVMSKLVKNWKLTRG